MEKKKRKFWCKQYEYTATIWDFAFAIEKWAILRMKIRERETAEVTELPNKKKR